MFCNLCISPLSLCCQSCSVSIEVLLTVPTVLIQGASSMLHILPVMMHVTVVLSVAMLTTSPCSYYNITYYQTVSLLMYIQYPY